MALRQSREQVVKSEGRFGSSRKMLARDENPREAAEAAGAIQSDCGWIDAQQVLCLAAQSFATHLVVLICI